jgi:uncharacterized damage-inducible protein DinB
MPTWRDHFLMLARYNLWATERLLERHVLPLTEAAYRRDCGLFFISVHGTLNHLAVAEQLLWYERFASGRSPMRALNEQVETDRRLLVARLMQGARNWAPLIESWPESRYAGTLDYTTTKGLAQSLPFAATLTHVFNHSTHHRGQVSAALTSMGHACPELDMVWMLQDEARAKAQATHG